MKPDWNEFDCHYDAEKGVVIIRWICFKCPEVCMIELPLDKNILFCPLKIKPTCPD